MSDYKAAFEALVEVVGWTGTTDPEKFDPKEATAHLSRKFIPRTEAAQDPEILKSVRGRVWGEIEGALAEVSGVPKRKLEGKDPKDAFGVAFGSLTDKVGKLEEGAKLETNEKVTALTEELGTWKHKAEEFDTARQTAVDALEEYKTTTDAKFKARERDRLLGEAMRGIEWKDGISDVEQYGFDKIVAKQFDFDLNGDPDKPTLVMLDKQGNRIPHPKTVGEFADPAETLKALADEKGLVKKNKVQTGSRPTFGRKGGDGDGGKLVRTPRPSLADKYRPSAQ